MKTLNKVYAILLAHSDLPKAYKKTLKNLFGSPTDFAFLSHYGLSACEMTKRLEKRLAKIKNKNVILFVDIVGGSWWHVCCALKEKYKNIAIISGFNLPLLLKFLQYRDNTDFSSLVSIVARAAKEGIVVK